MIFALILAGLCGVIAHRTVKVAGVYQYSRQMRATQRPHCVCDTKGRESKFCPAALLAEAMDQTHHDLTVELCQQMAALVVAGALTWLLIYLT